MPKEIHSIELLKDIQVTFPANPTHIDFVFCEHAKPQDLPDDFKALAQQADTIALETVGWSEEGAELRQGVADGDDETREELSQRLPHSPQGDFWRKIHDGLFSTQASIHYPEAPAGHPLATEYMRAVAMEVQAVTGYRVLRSSGSYLSPHELIPVANDLLYAVCNRDRYILAHFFPPQTDEEDTSESGSTRQLAFFGLMHRGLAAAIEYQAEIQGRTDISVAVVENGDVDVAIYEKFIRGEAITSQDVRRHYNL